MIEIKSGYLFKTIKMYSRVSLIFEFGSKLSVDNGLIQSDFATLLPEMDELVNELGFLGANLTALSANRLKGLLVSDDFDTEKIAAAMDEIVTRLTDELSSIMLLEHLTFN